MIQAPVPPQQGDVHLELTRVGAAGQSLGLKPGDKLVGLDGAPFTAGARAMAANFSALENKRVAMHFKRADMDLTVISVTPKLGRWAACPIAGSHKLPAIDTDRIENWEILRNREGIYDLFRHRAPASTWLLTPFWLAEMRLWPHLAAFLGMVAVGYIAGIAVSITLWALASHYVRKNYAQIIRADRYTRGMISYAVIAADSEMAAHRAYLNMEPDDQFAFGNIVLLKAEPRKAKDEDDLDYNPATA